MKKSIFILAASALACSAFAVQVTLVETNKVGDLSHETHWTYELHNTTPRTATLITLEDAVGDVTIKNLLSVGGKLYTVTNIADRAIANNPALLACTVPNTILDIGAYAFADCTSLAEITLEYGVRQIGERAFINTIVREIKLPDSVIELRGNISAGTLFTATINIDDSSHFVYSDDGVLYNKDMTTLYACPTRAEGTITIPESVTTIGADAFFGCFRLTYLNLPKNVNTIGSGAFNVGGIWPGLPAPESTPKLQSVFYNGTVPNTPNDIYNGAPAELTNYVFTIGWDNPWKGRPVNVIDNAKPPVLSIKDDYEITWSYRIINGTVEIYNEDNDGNAIAAIIPKSSPGVPYREDKDSINYKMALKIPSAINGYAVTRIGDHAFDGCKALTYIGIPASVEEIGDYAFKDCSSLRAIDYSDTFFPFGVTDGKIVLPVGVIRLGYHPFEGIKASYISIPYTMTEMDGNPLAGLAFLRDVEINDGNPNFCSVGNVIYDKRRVKVVGVPTNYDRSSISFLASVTEIGPEALLGCANIATVTLPDSLATISSNAFADCLSLTSMTIPTFVANIGSKAFADCEALTEVTYTGNAPTAPDDIYDNTPATLTSYAKHNATGFTTGTWKNRPISIVKVPDAMNQVYDDGTVNWTYNVIDGKAIITGADGNVDDKVVTIPGSLDGFTTSALNPTALDALSGVKAYESSSSLFLAKNGCLYSADGKTLIRVPNGITLPYSATTDKSTERVTVTTVPGLLESGNPGNDGTSVKTNKVVISSSTKTAAVGGDISFNTILAGVTNIVDHAFYGCNASLTDEHDDSSTQIGGETGFIGASGDPYVETVTLESHTITTYKTVVELPATVTSISGNAFEGSAVEVSRSGGSQSAMAVAGSASEGKVGGSAGLEANTSYIGWIEDGGRVTGTLSIKTGKKAKGVFKISGTAVRIGSKKKTIKSETELNALGDVKLVKDISKSKSEKTAFKAFKGKCWTIAYETVDSSETGIGGYATLSVSVAQNGKVSVKGYAPDGTKFSGSAQMVKDGDHYKIPLAVQSHTGKKGGIALCLAVGEDGSISADAYAEFKVVTGGKAVSLDLVLVDAKTLGSAPGSHLLVGEEAVKSGFELDSTLKGWKPRYTKSTGEIKGSVSFYRNSDGRLVKATVNGITVDGIGYCSATIKNVGSWPARCQ